MPARKKTRRSTRNNSILIFVAIVIALALISVVAAYFITNKKDDSSIKKNNQGNGELNGTWVSHYDGTMLTINGLEVVFEIPSVDETQKTTESISIEKNIVSFLPSEGPCGNEEGHYLYSIDQNGELFFKLIKDKCKNRVDLMSMTWFRL
jgi:hypothetical protein